LSTGRGEVGDAASVGWQITVCDTIWHAGASGINYCTTLPLLYLKQLLWRKVWFDAVNNKFSEVLWCHW